MASQSPSTDPPMLTRPPLNDQYCSKVLINATDEDLRTGIWGFWYWFAKCTGQLLEITPGASKFATLLNHLPNIISILMCLIRSIILLYTMMNARSFTLFWAYVTIVFFMSLHGLISAITLFKYKTDRFFTKVIGYMRKVSFDRMTPVSRYSLYRNIFTVVVFMAPASAYIIECFIRYNNENGMASDNSTGNSTSTSQNSIYGDVHVLHIFDAIVVVWGSFFGAAVIILYLLTNDALCREYAVFNNELTAHVKDGTIANLTTIKSFQSQLIDYLSMACYLNTVSSGLVSLTFMGGMMAQVAAQFAVYSFSAYMTGPQRVLYGIWTAQSIMFLVFSLRRPSELHSMMTETKHLIWLDHEIWSKCSDQQVHQIARDITERISAVDYFSKGMTSAKAGNYIFTGVVILIPFFVHILGGANVQLPAN